MPKLTKRTIDALVPAAKEQVVWDTETRGFGLRVQPTGIKTFLVQYRNAGGRSRRFAVGRYGVFTVDEARQAAKRILNDAAHGADPVASRKTVRDAPTVGELLDRYLADHVQRRNRASTIVEVRRIVEKRIRPALGALKVAGVTRTDLAKLHRGMGDTPRQANFTLAVCSKAFGLAEVWGMRPDGSNPCTRIERYPEASRERFLTAEELGRLGEVLRLAETTGLPWRRAEGRQGSKHERKEENRRTVFPWQVPAAIRLLLFTGCRLGEILRLSWSQVDQDKGLVRLAETKSGRPQVVVLNAPALSLLSELPKLKDSPWALPRTGDPKMPLAKEQLENAWQRIRAAAAIEDVRLHDLRHTVGTYAGQAGANAFLVRDLLRHQTLAMTGRYVNRAEDPVRELSDIVGSRIEQGLASNRS